MTTESITYVAGGIELLGEIQPLWEQLNRHHAAISPYFADDFRDYKFNERKAKLLKKYQPENLRIDIAQSQGCNMGYLISAIATDGVGEIESIFIEENFRGQAIGDQLMRRALAWLDGRGVHTKVIAVAVGNERAYSFYERFGFYPRVVTLKQRIKTGKDHPLESPREQGVLTTGDLSSPPDIGGS
jgi:GNAT superfamily N-acetyltransferase